MCDFIECLSILYYFFKSRLFFFSRIKFDEKKKIVCHIYIYIYKSSYTYISFYLSN